MRDNESVYCSYKLLVPVYIQCVYFIGCKEKKVIDSVVSADNKGTGGCSSLNVIMFAWPTEIVLL